MLFLTMVCTYVLRDCCSTNPFQNYNKLRIEEEEDMENAFCIEDPDEVQKTSFEVTM